MTTAWIFANLTLFVVALGVGVYQKLADRWERRPRAPYGAEVGRDADLRRVLHDLDAAA